MRATLCSLTASPRRLLALSLASLVEVLALTQAHQTRCSQMTCAFPKLGPSGHVRRSGIPFRRSAEVAVAECHIDDDALRIQKTHLNCYYISSSRSEGVSDFFQIDTRKESLPPNIAPEHRCKRRTTQIATSYTYAQRLCGGRVSWSQLFWKLFRGRNRSRNHSRTHNSLVWTAVMGPVRDHFRLWSIYR